MKTQVGQNHTLQYMQLDSTSNSGLKVPIGKGSRLTVYSVGSAVISYTSKRKLRFRLKSIKVYHEEMMAHKFNDCF
jgi:hypothetical protein